MTDYCGVDQMGNPHVETHVRADVEVQFDKNSSCLGKQRGSWLTECGRGKGENMDSKFRFLFTISITLMLTTLLNVPPGREVRAEIVPDNNPPTSEVWVTAPKESFKYGYISANVDCREQGQPRRMKFVSQIFAYCYGEVPSRQIVEDNKVFLHQVMKSSCGENYSVTYEYLYGPNDTRSEAEVARDRELRESGYGKHVEWHASVDYPSSRCR